MHRRRVALRLGSLLAGIASVAALGILTLDSGTEHDQPTRAATNTVASADGDLGFATVSSNRLANASEAVAFVHVDSISPSIWNSLDGSEPTGPMKPGSYFRMQWRTAMLRVTRVVVSTETLSLRVGDKVDLRLFGSGEGYTPSKDPTAQALIQGGDVSIDRVDGPLFEGDDAYVFLRHGPFPSEAGMQDAIVATNHYQGLFRIVDGVAVGPAAGRTADPERLVAMTLSERQRGMVDLSAAQSEWTAGDPLAGIPGLGTYGAIPDAVPESEAVLSDRKAAAEQVASAFSAAYGTTPDMQFEARMAVVQESAGLVKAFATNADAFIAGLGPPKVTVSALYFDQQSHAFVEYLISTPRLGDHYREGQAVNIDGRWQVAHDTFCRDLGVMGVVCPT